VIETRQESRAACAVLVVWRGRAFGFLFDPSNRARVIRVDEDISQIRIDGRSAPVHTSKSTGEHDAALYRRAGGPIEIRSVGAGVEQSAAGLEEIAATFGMFGCCVLCGDDFIRLEADSGKWRRFQRKWLCGPTLFARNVAFRDRPFFDAKHRF